MQNKRLNIQPVAVTNAASNMLNPTLTSAAGGVGIVCTQPYVLIRHIRAVNKTAASHTISMYKGATSGSAAGTEFAWNATVVPANSFIDWYGELRLDTGDFLTALADANTSIVLNFDQAEIGFAG